MRCHERGSGDALRHDDSAHRHDHESCRRPTANPARHPDVWEQFAIPHSLATLCRNPSAAKWQQFEANLRLASAVAAKRLQEMAPADTPVELTREAMGRRFAEVDHRVDAVVDQEGCAGPKLTEALHRFDVHATVDFTSRK